MEKEGGGKGDEKQRGREGERGREEGSAGQRVLRLVTPGV